MRKSPTEPGYNHIQAVAMSRKTRSRSRRHPAVPVVVADQASALVSYDVHAPRQQRTSEHGRHHHNHHEQSRSRPSLSTYSVNDAARDSRTGAFITAWPADEPYHEPSSLLGGQVVDEIAWNMTGQREI